MADLNYFAKVRVLQSLASMDAPPSSSIRELAKTLGRPELAQAFFEFITDHRWVERLDGVGFWTRTLPDQVWASAAVYLQKVARESQLRLRPIFDRWDDLSELSRCVLAESIIRAESPIRPVYSKRLITWFGTPSVPYKSILANEALQVFSRQRRDADFDRLLRALLAIPARGGNKRDLPYWFDQYLTTARSVYATAPERGLRVIEPALRHWIRANPTGARILDARAAVEDTNQDVGGSGGEDLFCLLRDLIVSWAELDPVAAGPTVGRYLRTKTILRRIAIYIISSRPQSYPD